MYLHFTPTHASWLNQVEVWFSLLARQALRGASFTRVRQLREAIDAFITVYNPQVVRFEWTKRQVRSVEPKDKYAYLHKLVADNSSPPVRRFDHSPSPDAALPAATPYSLKAGSTVQSAGWPGPANPHHQLMELYCLLVYHVFAGLRRRPGTFPNLHRAVSLLPQGSIWRGQTFLCSASSCGLLIPVVH